MVFGHEDSKDSGLAAKLYSAILHPKVPALRPSYDEAFIVLKYMFNSYQEAQKAGEPDSFQLPEEFAPANQMESLFRQSSPLRDFRWSEEQAGSKHERCSALYSNYRSIANKDRSRIAEKMITVDTLIDGLRQDCAEKHADSSRIISTHDKTSHDCRCY